MSTPQPAPTEGEEKSEERLEAEAAADEVMDELEDAEPVTGEDPFTDDQDVDDGVDLDLADVDVGEPVGEGGSESDDGGPEPVDDDDSPFTGIDDNDDDASAFDGTRPEKEGDGPISDLAEGEAVAERLNEGMARLAVIGLEDEFEVNGRTQKKDDLRDEFEEVFEVMQLGHFGEETAKKYLSVDNDVDPLAGFAASLVICSIMVVWMRPDGDELVDNGRKKVLQAFENVSR